MFRKEPYRCRHDDLWQRQIGNLSASAFAHRIGGCQDLIQRLVLYAKLDGHTGCVNTVHFNPSGELLLSGSDDRRIIFWDWAASIQKFSYRSGHDSNVFQAKVMPFSGDRSVVSCAADGQVRHAQILEDGKVDTKKLARHRGRAHKLAIEPGSPRLLYSCGEDGVVRHFDLRANRNTELFRCLSFPSGSKSRAEPPVVRLNAIVINPRNPHYFAVGGSDEYARIYDIRKVCVNASSMGDHPVDTYTPQHLIGSGEVHITCVAYSLQEELLASYNDEHIYLFEKNMGLGPNPKAVTIKNENISDGGYQVYKGHRNAQTVKGVNFFGPNSEYVVSGSDCGRIFIWKKKGGELMALMSGDDQVVNCLEPHPHATILATSGIDHDVKVWAPIAKNMHPLPPDADEIMELNKCGREEARFAFSADVIIHLLRLHRRHVQRHVQLSRAGSSTSTDQETDIDDFIVYGDGDKTDEGNSTEEESRENSQDHMIT